MQEPFIIVTKQEYEIEDIKDGGGLLGKFVSDNPEYTITETVSASVQDKRTRKKSTPKTKTLSDGSVIQSDGIEDELLQNQMDYLTSYDETSNLLRSSINQIDMLSAEVKKDLTDVRAAKMLKNKYMYIPQLANTLSALINSKISAVREMNSSITNSHNLDLKRMKELKLTEAGNKDEDKMIFDLYNQIITNPGASMSMPTAANSIFMPPGGMGASSIMRESIGSLDIGYESTIKRESLNAMMLESNPDVKTCVVYSPSDGRRWFEVMNVRTGEKIYGVETPDPMFLEDTTLDLSNMLARNINLDTTYPIILTGDQLSTY